jgi:hypothetical protein
MAAVLVGGAPLGEVVDVLHLPHGDVLVVRRHDVTGPAAELLVPFVKAMVPVVDVSARRLEVDPPEGLLDLTAEPSRSPTRTPTGPDVLVDVVTIFPSTSHRSRSR